MKSYASGYGRRLKAELRQLRDHAFAERCGTILEAIFPTLMPTPARGTLDCAGIDHCFFAEDRDDIVGAFQCKGFDVLEFQVSQLSQCLHSIDSFANSRWRAKQYSMIVNRIVKGEHRNKLLAALDKLVQAGKADKAHLYGVEDFIEMMFLEAQRQLVEILGASAAAFLEEHRSRMEEDVYVQDVPFQIDGRAEPYANPLRFAEERILESIQDPTNRRGWIFMTGEFGFGKTSFALHLADILHRRRIACLYVPAARCHAQSFQSENEFMWTALQVLLSEEVDRACLRHNILQGALKEIFKREKRIVLLFDGIDEHPVCWQELGLLSAFGIFKTFNTTCLFTVREEFLSDRSGHFQTAIKGGPGSIVLRLREWSDPLILEYAKLWWKDARPTESSERISHFEDTVRTGRYVEYYGDIPRRPLFLKMVMEDVAKNDLRNRNLAQLYAIFIHRKFQSDRATSTSDPVVLRPLSSNEDSEYVRACLFDLMTLAASRMYLLEAGEVRMQPTLGESELRKCARKVAGEMLDLPSILLHSVMVPAGRRKMERQRGQINVTFAHRSFQEFFLAHHVMAVLLGKSDDTAIVQAIMPKTVTRFVKGLAATLSVEERAHAHERCSVICGVTSVLDD